MGKTRYLFKRNGDIKGIFHAKRGMIKNRSGKNLTKAEEFKKRCKNTQNYTKRS